MFTTSNTVVTVLIIIWLLTLGRSIIIMCGGNKLFDKALKGGKTAFFPIINLFVMLEIADVSTFLGILLFIPGINLIILLLMSYKIGRVFDKSAGFTMGLMFLPFIFYPLLFRSDLKYKYRDENYFLALDSARADSINLMTEDEIQQLNNIKEIEEPVVDSIFKSQIEMIEPVEAYRASRLDQESLNKMENLTYDDYHFAPIERVEQNSPVFQNTSTIPQESEQKSEQKAGSMFISELEKEEELEIVDL